MKQYWVYILSSHKRTLYVGMTSNLTRRIYEHRNKLIKGFTQRYNITQLVYYEETNNAMAAIEREKQIKGWTRERKLELIRRFNPKWRDFGEDVVGSDSASDSSSPDSARRFPISQTHNKQAAPQNDSAFGRKDDIDD